MMVNKAKSRNKKKKSFKCNTCAVWKGGLQQSYRISVSCHLFLSLGVSWNTTTAGSGANPAELKTLASEKNYFWIYGSCWSFIMDSLSWSVGARGRHFGFLLLWFFGSCSTLGPKPSPGNWTEIKSFLWFSLILQAFVQRQRKKKRIYKLRVQSRASAVWSDNLWTRRNLVELRREARYRWLWHGRTYSNACWI